MQTELARWIEQCCQPDLRAVTRSTALHVAFNDWEVENRIYPSTITAFGRAMKETDFPKTKRNGLMMYKGIRLKEQRP
jgi:hypothetical protein